MNFFLPMILAFSVSVRTPNVMPNPLDYQLAFSYEKKGMVFMSVEKEQELGKQFTNEEYWAYKDYNYFYLKERYVSKTSKGICYNQIEAGLKYDGFYGGYALRHIREIPSHRLSVGWEVDKAIAGLVRTTAKIGVNSDFREFDYSGSAQFDVAVMKFLNVFALGIIEKSGSNEFYQIKTGISLEIPN